MLDGARDRAARTADVRQDARSFCHISCSTATACSSLSQGCNLLILDEPINHLDVGSREHFEAALDAFERTVIVVAHDRAFLRSFTRRLLQLREGAASMALSKLNAERSRGSGWRRPVETSSSEEKISGLVRSCFSSRRRIHVGRGSVRAVPPSAATIHSPTPCGTNGEPWF